MKPFSIYHLFKDGFSSLKQPLVDIVVKIAQPDRIFLLGASLHRRRSESIFNETAPGSQYISDCFLLVLISDLANKEIFEWQDTIEGNCKRFMPVTVIVVQTGIFEEWLNIGDRFACTVWQSALLMYGSKNLSITGINNFFKDQSHKTGESVYTDGIKKAREFLAGSELFRIRKQYAMSAFMLHQSAEQALCTLVKLGTGYRANTHNIDRLLRYASLVSYQVPDIFPQKTDREKHLLLLLQKAYVDSRYKMEYKICIEDLLCLTDKIGEINKILSGYLQQSLPV